MAGDRHISRSGRDDLVREDGRAIPEEGDVGRRKSNKPGGNREPAAPMSPTPQPGPLGEEPKDPADPVTPRRETIR